MNQYKKLIDDAKTPLYTGYTKLLVTMKMYNLKVRNGWSDKKFTQLLWLNKELLPK